MCFFSFSIARHGNISKKASAKPIGYLRTLLCSAFVLNEFKSKIANKMVNLLTHE